MTLAEYDRAMYRAAQVEQEGRNLIAEAQRMVQSTRDAAGLEYVHREPSFPGWHVKGKAGWFNTPREAVAAMEEKR